MTSDPKQIPAGLPDALLRVGAGGRVSDLNGLALRMFGLDARLARRLELAELIDDPSLERWLASSSDSLRLRVQARRGNGVPFAIDLSARRDADGGVLLALRELAHDRITDEARQYFDVAFESAPIGMAMLNTDGEYTRVNAALCEFLGRTPAELLGRRDQELTHPDDRRADVDAAWLILDGEIDTARREKRFLRPDGEVVWAIANLTFLRDDAGNPLSWIGQFVDITESKRRETRLIDLADRDALTGLANRRALDRQLQVAIDADQEGALLVIDLDEFKQINDRHGHPAGDRVLRGVAAELSGRVRGSDVVARIGGDEFAVLVLGVAPDVAKRIAGDLTASLGRLRVGGVELSASLGLSLLGRERSRSIDSLYEQADATMYEVKRRFRAERRAALRGSRALAGEPRSGAPAAEAQHRERQR